MPTIRAPDQRVVLARRANARQSNSLDANLTDASDSHSPYSDDLASVSGSNYTATSSNDDTRNQNSSAVWDLDMPQQRSRGFDEFAEKQLLPEETALMIKKFERAADLRFSRTYQLGTAVRHNYSDSAAHSPHVGLVVLPGANLPEVNRLEQTGMLSETPDQRDAIWRVSTAGDILSNRSVAPDLSIVHQDMTPKVVDNTRQRLERSGHGGRSLQTFRRDAVTIDSDKVEVLFNFRKASRELDLAATLIEVDVRSLWSLMHDYKHIILNSGPQMTVEKTKELLNRMIEAARRFCVRSPILFRMSTRMRIIDSNNTRYGVDNPQRFQTFTDSKGIQEIIMQSASYFSSLDPNAPGMDRTTQDVIRPRFLQMMTLLLSLINDNDLKRMADFLNKTYGILPTRSDLELLFLKVIPLTSINSKVFLQGLVPAVDQWQVPDQALQNERQVWRDFIRRLARKGYLLPASVEELGHRNSSWIMKWPTGGIHSSTVFSRLQHHGETSKAFNQIPTAKFSYEPDLKELTVIMTNDETYTIDPSDYEQICTLTKGLYSVTKCEDESICELEISETTLNSAINEAVKVVNQAIGRYNANSRPPQGIRRTMSLSFWNRSHPMEPVVFPFVEAATRLTRNQAMLNGDIVAVAYKLNGRNVPKSEAMRHMSHSYTKISKLFGRICEAAGRRNAVYYEVYISKVNQLLIADRRARQAEIDRDLISDAPIAQALGPDDADIPSPKIWYEYWTNITIDPQTGREILEIQAKADFVATITWRRPGQQAEITLAAVPTNFFVAPLTPCSETQQNAEVRVGDVALLVGRYMIIAVPQEDNDYNKPLVMQNWLEIQDAYSEEEDRRGKNFRAKERLPYTRFI